MQVDIVTGVLLILLAALMNGAYGIPMRFMPRWKWENIWIVWTVLSLWIFPLIITLATVPHPLQAYSRTSSTSLIQMGLMGLLWGSGVLLLGMSFPLVGVAVGAAVGLGCAAAVGTVLPILYARNSLLGMHQGFLVLLGLITMIIGVGICGIAGRAREKQQGSGTMVTGQSVRGFCFASVGGTLTAALNLALAAGATIASSVQQQHPATQAASIAVWLPVLLTGGLPGFLFTIKLLHRNRSGRLFREKGTISYWFLVPLMGILWLGSIIFYGVGVTRFGRLGLVIGWPVFMSGAVIASAVWGTLFGEWKGAGRIAHSAITAGVLCLVVAITIFATINR